MRQDWSPWVVFGAIAAVVVVVAAGSVAFAAMNDESPNISYPDRPANLSADSAVSFSAEYERAYAERDLHDRYRTVRDVEFRVTDSKLLNRTDSGYVVHLRVFLSWKSGDGVADHPYAVNYFVNESVVVRSEFQPEQSPGPDPRRNGMVVEGSQ